MIGTVKISQLPSASSLTGAESVIVNQNSITRLTNINNIVGLVTVPSIVGLASEGYVNNRVAISTSGLLNSSGDGSQLTGIVTSLVAGSNIILSGSTGEVTISVSGVSGLQNVVEDITPQLGGNLDLNSKDIIGTGNLNVSGIITSTGGFNLGISSSGTSITSGPVTELNFVGVGNTFAVNGTSIDISIKQQVDDVFIIACSDEDTDLTSGITAKATFTVPYTYTLTDVKAAVNSAPTGSNLIVDINKNGSSILSTKLSIDDGETSSSTAATPVVISDSSLPDGSVISIDIDQVGGTNPGKGLKVTLYATRSV